jgi:GTP1/Obg family GTP-binding protein
MHGEITKKERKSKTRKLLGAAEIIRPYSEHSMLREWPAMSKPNPFYDDLGNFCGAVNVEPER